MKQSLASAAGAQEGEVLIYCPSPRMQSKEVDARVEIQEHRVLPLRVQRESFAYSDDLKVLEQYYQELWCAYVFVSPEIYADAARCRAVIDHLCTALNMGKDVAYKKVRGHEFQSTPRQAAERALECVGSFIGNMPFSDVPRELLEHVVAEASRDDLLVGQLADGPAARERLSMHFEVVTLRDALARLGSLSQKESILEHCRSVEGNGAAPFDMSPYATFGDYQRALVDAITQGKTVEALDQAATSMRAQENVRERLLAMGETLQHLRVKEQFTTDVDKIIKYLDSLPSKQRDEDLAYLDKCFRNQAELLAANIKAHQIVRWLKKRREGGDASLFSCDDE